MVIPANPVLAAFLVNLVLAVFLANQEPAAILGIVESQDLAVNLD